MKEFKKYKIKIVDINGNEININNVIMSKENADTVCLICANGEEIVIIKRNIIVFSKTSEEET